MVNGQLSAHAGFESFAQATVTSAGASSRMTRRSPRRLRPRGSVAYLDTGVDLTAYQATGSASADSRDRATSQRPLPCAAVVALPAP